MNRRTWPPLLLGAAMVAAWELYVRLAGIDPLLLPAPSAVLRYLAGHGRVFARNGAATLRRGQKLLLRGAALPSSGPAYVCCFGAPIAFGAIEDGYFVSTRVFNLPQ